MRCGFRADTDSLSVAAPVGCRALAEIENPYDRHLSIMKRPLRSRKHLTIRTLLVEELEVRQLLTATGFQPDYIMEPLASSGISGYTPAQIRAAFTASIACRLVRRPPTWRRDKTIAIIDAYNNPNIASDLTAFDKALGIAAPPSFKIVNQSGGSACLAPIPVRAGKARPLWTWNGLMRSRREHRAGRSQ